MVYFAGDPWFVSDTVGTVKGSLVATLERLPADHHCDRAYARCVFDVSLRRAH